MEQPLCSLLQARIIDLESINDVNSANEKAETKSSEKNERKTESNVNMEIIKSRL